MGRGAQDRCRREDCQASKMESAMIDEERVMEAKRRLFAITTVSLGLWAAIVAVYLVFLYG